jgi:CheY-like chemotaxis protein
MSVALIVNKVENSYYLRALLEGHGWNVESARNGAEALACAASAPGYRHLGPAHAVMDGYTLLRHWKKDDRLKRVPFIVYTATYTDAEDEALALELGADASARRPNRTTFSRVREVQRLATPATSGAGDERGARALQRALIRKLEAGRSSWNAALRMEEAELRLRDRASVRRKDRHHGRARRTT